MFYYYPLVENELGFDLKQTFVFQLTFCPAIRYIPEEKSGDAAPIGARIQKLFLKDYFLNPSKAFFVKSLNTNFPEISARSYNKVLQCAVFCHKTCFISDKASGL